MDKPLEVDLYVAESGVRTDLRDGVYLVQVVLSTGWLSVEDAAEFLRLSKRNAGVHAVLSEIPLPEVPEEVPDVKPREKGKK